MGPKHDDVVNVPAVETWLMVAGCQCLSFKWCHENDRQGRRQMVPHGNPFQLAILLAAKFKDVISKYIHKGFVYIFHSEIEHVNWCLVLW